MSGSSTAALASAQPRSASFSLKSPTWRSHARSWPSGSPAWGLREQRAAGTVSGSLQSGAAEESSARGREGGRPRTTAVRGIAAPPRGHCLREHALAACRLAERRQLHTLVQMVDNGLGITLLPQLAIDGGILSGTALTVLPTTGEPPSREIGLVWRRGTGRQREFELLASVLTQLVEERPRP